MCLFALLYNQGNLRPFPLHKAHPSMYWVAVFFNIFVLIRWIVILLYCLVLIPKRIIWLIREGERRRILSELAKTEHYKRSEKIMDMCFPWLSFEEFGTDEFMSYLDRKFNMMEDAGMFGDNGAVLHELSWGYLEDDPFVGRMLESKKSRARYRKNLIVEELQDLFGKSRGPFVANEGYASTYRPRLEEWRKTQAAAQDFVQRPWIDTSDVETPFPYGSSILSPPTTLGLVSLSFTLPSLAVIVTDASLVKTYKTSVGIDDKQLALNHTKDNDLDVLSRG
ncbi:uncharacterized protein RAG0_18098 [Rhynchosporium agropyri]|uniref:Uncharacterized protein n=1 Tax=Rhynchosporium agropyri TaxID=914238 RepID=A0A1E1LST9_9HELO|nr:uncharacterized protein RAG0_18098 [Rhynchosporium agropyri]